MSDQGFIPSRRRFFGQAAVAGLGFAAVLTQPKMADAQAPLPELTETDPTAAALGYKPDTSTVDVAKYPNHKPEQICGNCNLAQGNPTDALRPCAIFPGKLVKNKGWCAAYVAKPA
jgi:hypothetical protein